jgi:hypothetical protein
MIAQAVSSTALVGLVRGFGARGDAGPEDLVGEGPEGRLIIDADQRPVVDEPRQADPVEVELVRALERRADLGPQGVRATVPEEPGLLRDVDERRRLPEVEAAVPSYVRMPEK